MHLPGPYRRPRRALGSALAVGLLLCGCSREPLDPLEERIPAEDTLALSLWRSHLDPHLTEVQRAAFDRALEEIKLEIMSQGVRGSTAVEEAYRKDIDGLTVRAAARKGLHWELSRAQEEWAALTASLARVEAKRYAPEDRESADLIAHLKEVKTAGLRAAADEIALTKSRLVAFGDPP